MILWISGPCGVGKPTLAERIAAKLENALVFHAEEVGNAVRENYPNCPHGVIFEDYPLWGEFCYKLLRDVHGNDHRDILVPMTLVRRGSYSVSAAAGSFCAPSRATESRSPREWISTGENPRDYLEKGGKNAGIGLTFSRACDNIAMGLSAEHYLPIEV